MKRLYIFIAVIAMAVLLLAGCAEDTAPAPPVNTDSQTTSTPANISWDGYFGTLVRRESSQYNNATLQVKGLDDLVVLFEIDMMEGSESENKSSSLQIAGTMFIEDDAGGVYEGLDKDGNTMYTIRFDRSADGMTISVSHTGEIPMNPDGIYDWVDSDIESDAGLAVALLENLPTAVTSLNSNIGAYTINYPEESVWNYFYPVTVTLDDTKAVLAEFVVLDDLSAVWRLDTEDGLPALIYGTAQDMLDKVVYLEPEENTDEDGATPNVDAIPLLNAVLDGGTFMTTGSSVKIKLDSPYPFAYLIGMPLSSNEDVATVSEDGTVTAHSPGTTTIMADIVVEDGKRGFMLEITVGTEGEAVEAEAENPVG